MEPRALPWARIARAYSADGGTRGEEMAVWRVAEAKARLSEVLDRAETEGPQVVRRRKTEFHLLTREQLAERYGAAPKVKPFVSGWDALAPSSGELFDVDFPRLRSKPRAAKF
jgi:hypothetical protein